MSRPGAADQLLPATARVFSGRWVARLGVQLQHRHRCLPRALANIIAEHGDVACAGSGLVVLDFAAAEVDSLRAQL